MWTKLREILSKDCRWALIGVWNFVENRCNKSTIYGRLISPMEKVVFDNSSLRTIFLQLTIQGIVGTTKYEGCKELWQGWIESIHSTQH
jgi:hypothetical protein